MSLRDRLRRLRREEDEPRPAGTGPAQETDVERDPEAGARAATTTGEPVELVAGAGPAGTWRARSTRYDRDAHHGAWCLDEVDQADPGDFALLTGDGALADLDLSRAVFLDTETTGLSGGAGTYVFLVGLGRFEVGEGGRLHFDCWQGFLPGPEEEAALLAECAARIRASSGVVSFFGKSFDRHRLEDKMRLVGVAPPFEEVPHLDLYHPLRRLYRGAYGDTRLQTLERELCGFERVDDLPGAFAPAAWFDYLAERPHRLEGVFRHNLEDVLSLVTLAAQLGRTRVETRADGGPLSGDGARRALGLARSLADAGDRARALAWLEESLARRDDAPRALRRERADHLRLLRREAEALEAYRELVAEPEDEHSVGALLELAKLLEHNVRDAAGALECCRAAAVLLDRHHTGPSRARLARDLEKRTRRLEGRVKS